MNFESPFKTLKMNARLSFWINGYFAYILLSLIIILQRNFDKFISVKHNPIGSLDPEGLRQNTLLLITSSTLSLLCIILFSINKTNTIFFRAPLFLTYLITIILESYGESPSYSNHLNLLILLSLNLNVKKTRESKRAALLRRSSEVICGRSMILLYYFLTGFWKVWFAIKSNSIFDINILNNLMTAYLIKWGKSSYIIDTLIDYPSLSYTLYLFIILLQFGSFTLFLFRSEKLIKAWGFSILIFTISSYFALEITFFGVLPGIFFFILGPNFQTPKLTAIREINRLFYEIKSFNPFRLFINSNGKNNV